MVIYKIYYNKILNINLIKIIRREEWDDED